MNIQETAALLKSMDRVLLLTHVRPDGDTIGSASALCLALRSLGREAYLLYNAEITETYRPYAETLWAPEGWTPEYVVSVDVADLGLLPENATPWRGHIALAVDHHESHGFFAEETCLDAGAAACGEIIYEIIRQLTDVTPEIALRLYVAVSTDTGCFVYSNTTARTHRVAAALMETGIQVAPVNNLLFRTKSRVRLAMESRMIADMETYHSGKVVITRIPLALREELHATDTDIEELSTLAPMVEGNICGITLRELAPGRIKVSVRATGVNASDVCRRLGGGGHAGAAGATVEGTMEEVRDAVLRAVEMEADL